MCARGVHSGRQSSEGTLSEHTASDGAQTAMTSLMGTDEETVDDVDNDTDEHDSLPDADFTDAQSVFPAGQHHNVASSHRTEVPYSDEGSFMGTLDQAASTRSLWAPDLDYRYMYGRTYCKDWFMPIDEPEQVRMYLLHQVFLHVFGGEHSTVYLDNPTNILDVGTGRGEWAIRMGEVYPNCDVVGIDIAAEMPTKQVPMNVSFLIEDAEDWIQPENMYDLIHFRTMEGAFKDWNQLMANVCKSLKPGGWMELQDFDSGEGFIKFLSQFPPDSPMHTIMGDLVIAAEKSGRPRGNFHLDPRMYIDAGFVDVRQTEYLVPITVGEKSSAGQLWLVACLDALEALCLRLLTEHMGWDPEECKKACLTAAMQLAEIAKDPVKSKGLVIRVVVIVGRKPIDEANSQSRTESLACNGRFFSPPAA